MDLGNRFQEKLTSCVFANTESKSLYLPSENHLHKPENMYSDQKIAAYSELAFWSHPAWLNCDRYSLYSTAVTQWVVHHRTWITANKLTVDQIIGGVRGVIPHSKLAKYGDYRYDVDCEEIYSSQDEMESGCKYDAMNLEKELISNSLNSSKHLNVPYDLCKNDACSTSSNLIQTNKSLDDWLKKMYELLTAVRRLTDRVPSSKRTEASLKDCLRFLYAALINKKLLQLMNTEISFSVDYKELMNERVRKIELHAIPQPCVATDSDLDDKSVNQYWLKLSTPGIRKIWIRDSKITTSRSVENAFDSQIYPLVWINFLRTYKYMELTTEKIDIPNSVANEYLGSLLQTMDKKSEDLRFSSGQSKYAPTNTFPEAHGEWIRSLFPCRVKTDGFHSKEQSSIEMNQMFPNSKIGAYTNATENMAFPFRYYMTVPPPPLVSPTVCNPQVRPPYIYHQAQKPAVLPQGSRIMNQQPEQVHFIVPVAPLNFRSTGYISRNKLPNWNCKLHHINAPLQVTVQGQNPTFKAPTVISQCMSSKNISESQGEKVNIGTANFGLKKCLQTRRDVQLKFEFSKDCTESKKMSENISVPNKTTIQLQHTDNTLPIRTHMSTVNMNKKCNVMYPVNVIPRCIPAATSNSQIKIHSRPFYKYREMNPDIQHASPQNFFSPYFNVQPRFIQPFLTNDVQYPHDRMNTKINYISNDAYRQNKRNTIENLPLSREETSLGYKDKVQKWLEDVNKCTNDKNLGYKLKNFTTSCNEIEKNKQTALNSLHENLITDNIHKENIRNLKSIGNLHLFQRSCGKFKKSKPMNKIKLLKRFLVEINLKYSTRFNSRMNRYTYSQIKNFKQNKSKKRLCKFKESSCTKLSYSNGVKGSNNFDHSSGNIFSKIQDKFSLNYNYKTFLCESYEFNTFPSKRIKLSNAITSIFYTDPSSTQPLNSIMTNINYFSVLIDNLLFSNENRNSVTNCHFKDQCRYVKEDSINGWIHFKLAIKNYLKNVLAENQNVYN